MNLILASASKGRRHLLSLLQIPFSVVPSGIDEEVLVGKTPRETLRLRAHAKALHVAKNSSTPTILLTADSGVIFEGKLFGKPKHVREAETMLKMFSGTTHIFTTAVYAVKKEKTDTTVLLDDYDETRVTFGKLSQSTIKEYLTLTDFKQFAGSYGITDSPQTFIKKIEGSISNVIGLPLEKIVPILHNILR